jgi:hypothetical protein
VSAQREFIKELEKVYPSLAPILEQRLRERAALDPEFSNPLSFKLVAIDLPEDPQQSKWELSFETEPPSWFFVVEMEQFSPAQVTIEC